MQLAEKKVTKLLYSLQGFGIVFVAFFLAAYLAGLPTTAVLHSKPFFRIPLFGSGVILLVLLLAALIAANLNRSEEKQSQLR